MRLKSIKNIGKITKSMKMIASTKLNRAQKAMEIGRTFGLNTSGNSIHLLIYSLLLIFDIFSLLGTH